MKNDTVESRFNNCSLIPKIESKRLDLSYLHHSKYKLENYENNEENVDEDNNENMDELDHEIFVND